MSEKQNEIIEQLAGKWNRGEIIHHSDLLIAVFAAGRAYQAGKDSAALKKLSRSEIFGEINFTDALAALEAAKGE